MASSSLDLALGDIISQNRSKGGRGGRGGRRGGEERKEGGSSGPIRHNRRGDRSNQRRDDPFQRQERTEQQWVRDLAPVQQQSTQKLIGDTIRVSNLAPTNTEDDLRFIFEKIGPIQRITIAYNQQGQSTGNAEVQFGTNLAAENAVKQLDQAEVDGRLMYVSLIGQLVQASLPVVQRRRDGGRDDGRRPERRDQSSTRREGGNDGGRRQGGGRPEKRGGGGGGRGGRGGRQEKKEVKPEDLDAEMDSYHSSKPAASSTTAEAAPAPAAE